MRHPTNGLRPRRAHSAFIAGGVASVLLCLAVAATVAAPASALSSGCVQAALTVTCTYTAGVNEFDVPKGVSSIHVAAIGGAGGSAVFASGGFGAKAAGDFAVSPGQSLFAVVGANGFGGGGGYNGGGGAADSDSGGGGGGASDLRTTADDPASRLLVAGGGGGGGFTNPGLTGGGGGNAGEAGDDGVTDPSIGGDAGRGGTAGTSSAPGSGGAGGAGQTAGCDGDPGGLGAQSNGGAGGTHFGGPDCAGGGGGGGGGYYGGGGGGGGGTDATGTVGSSGGGGGGSSLVPAGGTLATDSTGVPEITISYTVPDSVSPTSIDFGSQAVGSSSAPHVVTLRNTGAASIYVTSVSKAGANPGDFTTSADTCTGTTIAPGDNCTIKASFAPSATGGRSASLAFNDDADDSPQLVALSGTGTTLADVGVSISGPGSALPGSQQTYVITTNNAGPSTAANAVLTARIPVGTKFVGVSTTRGACTSPGSGATTGTINCTLGDLSASASALTSATLKIVLTSKGGTVALVAQAASTATPDPNLANNAASISTSVKKK